MESALVTLLIVVSTKLETQFVSVLHKLFAKSKLKLNELMR